MINKMSKKKNQVLEIIKWITLGLGIIAIMLLIWAILSNLGLI